MRSLTRRGFLGQSAAAAIGTGLGFAILSGCTRKAPPSERIAVGLIGCGGQGRSNAKYFLRSGMADIITVCDVDDTQIGKASQQIEEVQGKKPVAIKDFRRILDDSEIDAVVVSTPDHWHALPTILACEAGKDVYVEKPLSHTFQEGTAMIEAARQNNRVVQMGTQQRSGPHYKEAIEYVRSGKLGKIAFARGWVSHVRPGIPVKEDCDPPKGVDYDMWLGPAPVRPFNPNRFHYDWRWFWDYGTGELGNWGVHHFDILVWGLDLGQPEAVYTHGGNFAHKDASETPDTQLVVYEYPDLTIEWEHRVWSRHSFAENRSGAVFNGTEGTLVVTRDGWNVYPNGKDAKGPSGRGSEMHGPHVSNFIECVKNREKPISDVVEGNKATVLCHLGNIAYRLDRKLHWNPETERFVGDEEADTYLTKGYRDPWGIPQV